MILAPVPASPPGLSASLGPAASPPTPLVTVSLSPADRLYFYSDGIVEARDPAGTFFGDERLLATLAECRSGSLPQSLARVKNEVSAWCGAAGPDDDISMIGVQITE